MINCLIISGAPGIGKSTIAEHTSVLLADKSIRHGLFDLDYLRWLVPNDGRDYFNTTLGLDNLHLIWPNFVTRGATCAIVVTVVEENSDIENISKALGGADCAVALLTVNDDVFLQRLVKDGRATQNARDWHVNRRKTLESQWKNSDFPYTTIDVSEYTPDQAAQVLINQFFSQE